MTLTDTTSWLEPTAIISVIGTLLALTLSVAIPMIIKHYLQRYIDGRDAKNAELEQLRHEKRRDERKREIKEVVEESTKPIGESIGEIVAKVDDVNRQLSKVEDGTLSTLRNDILTCYYKCCEKGYRNDYDYENVHHMFESYAELNGNSFIKDVVGRFDELPTKEEFKTSEANKKKAAAKKPKKVLVESK